MIKIMFESFKNPNTNVVSETFKLATQTSDRYSLDFANGDLIINFFCEYPCATCDSDVKT